jgi:hypothetical protein
MSIYYSPELVRQLMDERVREARRASFAKCCVEPAADEPTADEPSHSILSFFRRRPQPAACTC